MTITAIIPTIIKGVVYVGGAMETEVVKELSFEKNAGSLELVDSNWTVTVPLTLGFHVNETFLVWETFNGVLEYVFVCTVAPFIRIDIWKPDALTVPLLVTFTYIFDVLPSYNFPDT